jgi:hypothetical protein
MTFEELLARSRSLRLPETDRQRYVDWLGIHRVVGFSLQPEGGVEIFLRGERLAAVSPLVRRHMQYDTWEGSEATFIAEELFRHGFETTPVTAFAAAEPIIEIALRRLAASDELVVGLIGELRVLNLLLSQASTAVAKTRVLESWGGHRRQARDFTSDRAAIEVKTTTLPASVHRISGLSQVDPLRDPTGTPIESLYLLSIGLVVPNHGSDPGATITLPRSVDESLAFLGPSTDPDHRNDLQTLYLERLRSYGGGGYDHDAMRNWPAYAAKYSLAFMRIYDMQDTNIRVLRRLDVRAYDAVDANSITYEVHLPEQVTGDANPRLDVVSFASEFLANLGGEA